MSNEEYFAPNPFGGLLGTANSWLNLFTGLDALKAQVPGLKSKGTMDNLTVMTGSNDRMTLFGPSLVTNLGANYSTSFDPIGFGVQNYVPAGKWRDVIKLLLGSGDIKLAFGPSTSLLYGGPGGSSKRGPYWDRIAGTWFNPREKGSKYSAEGSFSPKAVGKKSGDGLQFIERDQIFGEENYDGRELAIMVNKDLRFKVEKKAEKVDLEDNKQAIKVTTTFEGKSLDNVKKDKYESDLEKCYTTEELNILKAGDRAAWFGTGVLALCDLAALVISICYANQIQMAGPQGGSFTSDRPQQINKARKDYESAMEKTQTTKTDLDQWDKDPSWSSDNPSWQKTRAEKQKKYDDALAEENAKKKAWQDSGYRSGDLKGQEQRDLSWGRILSLIHI